MRSRAGSSDQALPVGGASSEGGGGCAQEGRGGCAQEGCKRGPPTPPAPSLPLPLHLPLPLPLVTPGPRLPFPGRVGLCAHMSTRNLSKRKGVARLDICSRERTRCRLHVVFPAMHPRSLRGRTLRHAPRLPRAAVAYMIFCLSHRGVSHVASGMLHAALLRATRSLVPRHTSLVPCRAPPALHGRPCSRCAAGLPHASPCGRHGAPPAPRARGHRRRRLRARR